MTRVLVADDSREFAQMVGATLEEAGFSVVTSYSGPAAIKELSNGRFAAAVLDVLMPGISGDAVAERVRQLDPHLPVLLMTGDAGDPFVAASGLPVLHKPFHHEELVAAVRNLVGAGS